VASVIGFSQQPDVDRILRAAIRDRRLVTFVLHGFPRRVEPHDYGIIDSAAKLFFYQVGGRSRSRPPVGWRWAFLSDIRGLEMLEEHFPGTRDTGGPHAQWDLLFASVSRDV
jgi:hypothetical protein